MSVFKEGAARTTGTKAWALHVGRLLKTNSLASGISMLAGGTVAGQIVALASVPILSRLYSPADFGVLAVYASLLSSVVVVITLRYETAIAVADSDQMAAQLLALSLAVCLLVSAAVGVIFGLMRDSLSAWTNTPSIRSFIWLLAISGCAAGVYQSFSFWAIRRKSYSRLAATRVTQNVWMAATQIGLGLLRSGPFGLVIGDSLKWAGGSSTLILAAWRKDGHLLKRVRLPGLLEAAREYSKFPLLTAPSSLANSLGQQLPALIIAGFYGPHVAGSFYLVQKILAVPVTFVSRAIGDAYIGEFAQRLREDRQGAERLFGKLSRGLLAAGIIPTVVLVLGGGTLVQWVLGSSWGEAGTYLQVVAVMFLAKFVVNPLSQTLILMQHQGTQLAWDIGRMVFVNVAIFVVAIAHGSPMSAVCVYAITMFIAYVLLYTVCKTVFRRNSVPVTTRLVDEQSNHDGESRTYVQVI
ncbi:MAG TPA: oligosaccharide flippase family protein [Gemmatimonadaceae bacterium]|nr:oligosaccharide flippase family protein [Gemmatimonadaceae bacterium]